MGGGGEKGSEDVRAAERRLDFGTGGSGVHGWDCDGGVRC